MSGKNLVLELNTKMLLANQIAGFLNLNNYWSYEVDFLHAGTYLLKLQIDYVILGRHSQACPGMPKEDFKTFKI